MEWIYNVRLIRRNAYRKSKWLQATLMAEDTRIAGLHPSTALFSRARLDQFIDRHPVVYIKPDQGGKGVGIIRIDRLAGRKGYRIRCGTTKITVPDRIALHRALRPLTTWKRYIIQQGVQSVTHDGRPFDIRVHVQRVGGNWVVGGMVGKLGGAGNIVTNRYQGGKPLVVKDLLVRCVNMDQRQAAQVILNLHKAAVHAAEAIGRVYPRLPEFGVDIGVEKSGRLWIYEVNINPGIVNFAKIARAKYYRRILGNRRKGA